MFKAEVKVLHADTYERWGEIYFLPPKKTSLYVHFMLFNDYRESDLEKVETFSAFVELKITYINEYELTDKAENYIQEIKRNPQITAIATVKEFIDDCTVVASIEPLNQNIILEFESKFILKVKDRIKVKGDLEMLIIEKDH